MKVRGAAALTAAVLVSGALLAACSSGPTPQGVAAELPGCLGGAGLAGHARARSEPAR